MEACPLSELHRRLGAALEERRAALGLTRAVLGTSTDHSSAFIGKIEKGEQNITFGTLDIILSAFNALSRQTRPRQDQKPTAGPAACAFFDTLAQALGIAIPGIHPGASLASVKSTGPRQAYEEVSREINPLERRILKACLACPRSATELHKMFGYKTRTGNFKAGLNNLLAMRLLKRTMPRRHRSRHQKYCLTARGRTALAANRI
jgi:transcriptional regulator with XRE-family HTH domain